MPKVTEVAPGIRMIETPFGGVPLMLYHIQGDGEPALVESGISTTPAEHLLPFFRKLGRGPELLVNTHGHVDHFGGNAAMRVAFPESGLRLTVLTRAGSRTSAATMPSST
jgi:glyoxylase-like metal-dependent hydrolase (beta-lactamase superfamily II)